MLDPARLGAVRAELDRIDGELLALLAARRQKVLALWVEKRAAGVPLRDPERERALLDARRDHGRSLKLPSAASERVMRAVLDAMHDPSDDE